MKELLIKPVAIDRKMYLVVAFLHNFPNFSLPRAKIFVLTIVTFSEEAVQSIQGWL